MSPRPTRLEALLSEKLADSPVPPPLTPRRIAGRALMQGKATAVLGMRRAGKTWFLHQLRGERIARGADPAHVPFVSFEDERLAGIEAADLNLLVEAFYRRFPGLRGHPDRVLWCLDEIQVVPGWEGFVRRLLDTEAVDVVVSGSSAALLSREIATSLRGRGWPVVIHPFGFGEVLDHAGHARPADIDAVSPKERSELERGFADFLQVGGFPEAQGLDAASRFQLLRDYVDVAMLRDVLERHHVGNVAGLRWLVRHLLGNAAGSFSVERFHAALRSQGIAIARDTVHQLLAHVEDCFLVRTVWMEASSERQRMVNPRKVYPVDPGLIPVFDRSGRANLGHALETAVLIELERRRAEVTYVKTPQGYEVDFLARYPDGHADLIQVCADASGNQAPERELRALAAAGELHPRAQALLLTATVTGLPAELPAGVVALPAWRWMLEPDSP